MSQCQLLVNITSTQPTEYTLVEYVILDSQSEYITLYNISERFVGTVVISETETNDAISVQNICKLY